MKVNRMDRVNELLRREIGQICERVIAPYTTALVTVAKVKVSPDLRQGNVYISIMGKASDGQKVMKMLKREHGHIQREMARNVTLKYTPKLTFIQDGTFAAADRVEHLLRELDLVDDSEEAAEDNS